MTHSKSFCLKAFLLLSIHFILLHTLAYSQGNIDSLERGKADSIKKADSIETTRISKLPILVQKVYNYNGNDTSGDRAGIGDIIVVKVQNLDSLLNLAKANTQNISLYINGRKIEGTTPLSKAPDKSTGTLQYRLDRNSTNNKIWVDILGSPAILKDDFFIKEVKISVGLENAFAIKTTSDDNNFKLIRIHKGWFWACCFLLLVYLIVLFSMIKSSGLLRDRCIDLSAIGIQGTATAYSLGRFQMAFWFTLTIASFFFIWLITDAYDIITPSVLALIGISAGTSMSAAVIDNSKSTELLNQTIALQNEKNSLSAEILDLDAQIQAVAPGGNAAALIALKKPKADRVSEIIPLIIRNKIVLTPPKSDGFFNDILTDANGISFHRLQMLVWTFVLGLIFLYSVWKNLSMPEFSATLLALQGLTSATYLGFKFPEKQA